MITTEGEEQSSKEQSSGTVLVIEADRLLQFRIGRDQNGRFQRTSIDSIFAHRLVDTMWKRNFEAT